jgi:SnoaL-like domain
MGIKQIFMPNTGEIIKNFYDAVIKRDIPTARTYLKDDLLFLGLFETYRNADEYIAALTGLLQITVRLDVKAIIAEGENVAIFFELETKAPAAATTLVAEWHQVKDGKIVHVQSAFDGRPFEAMFTGK